MLPESSIVKMTIARPAVRDWPVFRQWAEHEGWRVPMRELALYREELADSALVLRDETERPLGFVTVCRQLNSAWIGNLIVDPQQRGFGYGRRLFQRAVSDLSARGVATLWLTASNDGRPLYESFGFREIGRIERWLWSGIGGGSPPRVDDGERNLYSLVKADTAAWGCSRAGLLTLLARGSRIVTSGNAVAMLQPGDDLCVLGPWLSSDLCPRDNRLILNRILDCLAGAGEIAVDINSTSPVRPLLHAAGFRQSGETVLMRRGDPEGVRHGEVVALASLGSMG